MAPDLQTTPFDLSALASRGDTRSVTDRRGSWTGAETVACAKSAAASLAALSAGRTDFAVGLDLPGGRDWLAAAAGAWFAGFRVVPVSPHWPVERRVAALSDCDAIVTEEAAAALFAGDQLSEPAGPDGTVGAVVLETSGSSGAPKRILHTRLSAAAQARNGAEALGLSAADEWLAPLPFSHAGGVGAVLRCLHAGAAIDIREGADLDELMELLSGGSSAATVVSLVPTQLSRLLDAGWTPSERLRAAVIGGAALPESVRLRAVAEGVPIRPSWGMTEALGLISLADAAGKGEGPGGRSDEVGSGRPIPGVEVAAVGQGAARMLRVKGDSIAPQCLDSDGWFDTGDAGDIVDGRVHVVGRAGGMIVSGGENVAPDQVAEALLSIPGIVDAKVFGEPDPEWGQRVVAEVVADGTCELDQVTVIEQLRGRLSRWEIPKRVDFVKSIARNEMGKEIGSA